MGTKVRCETMAKDGGEGGCEIYCVHDEGGHFPEECCVFAEGEDWEYCEDIIDTIDEVI